MTKTIAIAGDYFDRLLEAGQGLVELGLSEDVRAARIAGQAGVEAAASATRAARRAREQREHPQAALAPGDTPRGGDDLAVIHCRLLATDATGPELRGPRATMDDVIREGIRAAQARSVAVDELVAQLLATLPSAGRVAAVALGSYGRQELTSAADVELLVLHAGGLSAPTATEALWFPLFERKLHLEPQLKTVVEASAEIRQSLASSLSALDARFVAGDRGLFDELEQRGVGSLRRDRVACAVGSRR